MQVTKRIELDYGHTLPEHYGYCSMCHGHRATIEATVEGGIIQEGSSHGMVMDFGIVKKVMMEKIHTVLDHGFAVWKGDTKLIKVATSTADVYVSTLDFIRSRNTKCLVLDDPPTAETLAKWCFYQIKDHMAPAKLVKIRFFETPNSVADYTYRDLLDSIHDPL